MVVLQSGKLDPTGILPWWGSLYLGYAVSLFVLEAGIFLASRAFAMGKVPPVEVTEHNLISWATQRAVELGVGWGDDDRSPPYRVLYDVLGRWERFRVQQMDIEDVRAELCSAYLRGVGEKPVLQLSLVEVVMRLVGIFTGDGPGVSVFGELSLAELVEVPMFADSDDPFVE